MAKTYYLLGLSNEILAGPFFTEESAQRAQIIYPTGEIRDSEEMQAAADAHHCFLYSSYSENGANGPGMYCEKCGHFSPLNESWITEE